MCSKTKKKLCNNNDCVICYERSFATHEKAKFWSKDNDKNITPRNVLLESHLIYKFDCVCEHTFEIKINNITSKNALWCPYCNAVKLCDNKDCAFCFEKSFASHLRTKNWNKNNKI